MRPEKGVLRYAASIQTAGHGGGGFRRRAGAHPRRVLLVEQQLDAERRFFVFLFLVVGRLCQPQWHAQRERIDAPARLPAGSHLGLQVGPVRHDRQLRRRRLGQGTHGPGLGGSSSSRARTRPSPPRRTSSFQGKTVLYYPILIAPITVSYNLSGVSNLEAVGADHRGHLLGQDQELERPGDQGGQLRRDPAQHLDHHRPPLGLLGHHRRTSPSSSWRPGGAHGRSVPARSSTGPASSRGGNGNAGVSQIIKSTPGAIGYVDYADRQGLGTDLRFDQEQGRQLRRTFGRRPPPPPARPPSSPT